MQPIDVNKKFRAPAQLVRPGSRPILEDAGRYGIDIKYDDAPEVVHILDVTCVDFEGKEINPCEPGEICLKFKCEVKSGWRYIFYVIDNLDNGVFYVRGAILTIPSNVWQEAINMVRGV